MTKLVLDYVRAQFPAFSHPESAGWAHLENAGGSYVPTHVIELLTHFYTATKVQPYVAPGPSATGGAAMDRAYDLLPATLNAGRDEVHFGPSTSQNTYVLSRAMRPLMSAGDEVIVTNQDHESNIGSWQRLDETGLVVKEWTVDAETGLLDVAVLESLLSDRTSLVCVTHASNVVATVNPIRQIADLVHSAGALLVVDGVSYAPHAAIDVQALNCDVYLYSTYKTYGPHIGLMYTRPELLDSITNQGHYFNAENRTARLTPAGPNHAEIAASAGIVDYYQDLYAHHFGSPDVDLVAQIAAVFDLFAAHEETLMAPLLELLAGKDVRVVGAMEPDHTIRAPTIAFRSDRLSSADIWSGLADQRIASAHGNFYARRLMDALGFPPDDGVVRLSMVHYNTHEEVERAVQALDRIL